MVLLFQTPIYIYIFIYIYRIIGQYYYEIELAVLTLLIYVVY